MEYKIAKKNNKIICHLNKWQNLKKKKIFCVFL